MPGLMGGRGANINRGLKSKAVGRRGLVENLGLRLHASLVPKAGTPAPADVAHLGTSILQSRVTFIGALCAVPLQQGPVGCSHSPRGLAVLGP